MLCPLCNFELVPQEGSLLLEHPANGCDMESELFTPQELTDIADFPISFFFEDDRRANAPAYDSHAMAMQY